MADQETFSNVQPIQQETFSDVQPIKAEGVKAPSAAPVTEKPKGMVDTAEDYWGKKAAPVDEAITGALAPNPKNYRPDSGVIGTQVVEPAKTLGREVYSGAKTALGMIPGIYHAFADEATPEEKANIAPFEREAGEAPGTETSGFKRIGLGLQRMSGIDAGKNALKTYADPNTRPTMEQALSVAPEAMGQGAGTVVAGEVLGKGAKEIATKPLAETLPTAAAGIRKAGQIYQKGLENAPNIGAGIGAVTGAATGGPGGAAYGTYTGGRVGKIIQQIAPSGRSLAELGLDTEAKNVQRLENEVAKAEKAAKPIAEEHATYEAGRQRGLPAPDAVLKAHEKAQGHLQLMREHLDAATQALADKAAQATAAPMELSPEQQAAQDARTTPAPTDEALKTRQEKLMSDMEAKAGIEKPQPVPQNVKTPGQVQPETFPQEPTAAPQVEATSRMRPLAGNAGVLQGREPLRLTEGTPEPAAESPKGEVLPPEAPVAKMGKPGRLGALKAQGGTVVDTEPDLQQKIEEGLQGTAKPQAIPPKGDLGRLKTPALPETNDKGQTLGFNFKPAEDVGRAVREEAPPTPRGERRTGVRNAEADEMTKHFSAARKELGEDASFEQIEARAKELKAGRPEATSPNTEWVKGKEGGWQEFVKAGQEQGIPDTEPDLLGTEKELKNEDRSPEHLNKIDKTVSELPNQDLQRLGTRFGVDESKYDFSKREALREGGSKHPVDRIKFSKDTQAKLPEALKDHLVKSEDDWDKNNPQTFDSPARSSKYWAGRSRAIVNDAMNRYTDELAAKGQAGGDPEDVLTSKEAADKEYNRLKSLREGTAGAEKAQGYGESNTGVTKAEAEEAAARLNKKLMGGMKVGLDPTTLADAWKIGQYHLEAGARSFAEWSGKMTEQLGEAIKPHLQSIWDTINEKEPGTKEVGGGAPDDAFQQKIEELKNAGEKHGLTNGRLVYWDKEGAAKDFKAGINNSSQWKLMEPDGSTRTFDTGADANNAAWAPKPKVSGGKPADVLTSRAAADKENTHLERAQKEMPNATLSEQLQQAAKYKEEAKAPSKEAASAQADYDKEKEFSGQVLSGEKTVKDFPYHDSYKRTINAESRLLDPGSKVLFVGGGPMPLSSMMFADKGFNVDTMELDPETAKIGEQVAKKSGAKTGKFITGDARDFDSYGKYDAVVVALEAGPEASSKNAVLKQIIDNSKPGTKILARGTAGTGGADFVNTAKNLPDGVRIADSIDTFDGLSKTHVLEDADAAVAKEHNDNKGSSLLKEGKVEDGYSVGINKNLEKILNKEKITPEDVKSYRESPEVQRALKDNPKAFIGTWVDGGETYLDTSIHEPDLETAKKIGKDNNQMSIFDAKAKESIPLEKGESLTLHHWSNVDGLNETDPSKFGTGKTGAEQARAKDPGFLPRTHFGDETYKEPAIQGQKNHYTAEVDPSKYYDIAKDPDGIWQKALKEGGATAAENAVHDAGYHGYFHDGGYVSFEKAPVKPFRGKTDAQIMKEGGAGGGSGAASPKRAKEKMALGNLSGTDTPVAEHIIPEEDAGLKTNVSRKNFISNMAKRPALQEWMDVAQQGAGERRWYQRGGQAFTALSEAAKDNPDVAHYFQEGDRDKFINFTAAASPQQSVKMDLQEALHAWTKYKDMVNPTDAQVEKMLSKEMTISEAKVPNAMLALQGKPMWPDLTKNRAFKAPSFGENLIKGAEGDKAKFLQKVTNDGWMGLWGDIDNPEKLSSPSQYHPLSVMARAAGKALGWEPEEAQAAIWAVVKTLTEKATVDQADIRQYSHDFADLMQVDPDVRSQLKEMGVNLDELNKQLAKHVEAKPEVPSGVSSSGKDSLRKLVERVQRLRPADLTATKAANVLKYIEDAAEPEAGDTGFNPAELETAKPNVEVTPLSERPKKTILSVKVDGETAGQMSMTPMPELGKDAMEISTSQLNSAFRSKGHGTEMYKKTVDYARSKGVRTLYSDDQVSSKADNVWQSLVRSGDAKWDEGTKRYKIEVSSLGKIR